jgi:hypothetical protein
MNMTPMTPPTSSAPAHRFWCEATQTWLYRDDSRRAFKNRPLDEQPPPPDYLPRAWQGTWQTSSDGLMEIRPFVESREDGSFLAGLEESWQGGDSGQGTADEARDTLELAKAEAARLASDWHHRYDAPEETLAERPRAGN